jgi:hypothetical protein
MKLRYINKDAVEPVLSYNIPVRFGSVIDSAVWGEKEDHLLAKALSTKNWEKAGEDAELTDEVEAPQPKKRGGKKTD